MLSRALIALAASAVLASAAHAACTTNTPVNLFGQNGGNGLLTNSGTPGFDATGAVGQIAAGGGMGTANFRGDTVCEDNTDDLLAVSAALANPVWLEHGENFAVSGGLGFSEGATAFGATGIVRIDKGLSGYAGGAVSTDDSSTYAGKLGLRVGW